MLDAVNQIQEGMSLRSKKFDVVSISRCPGERG